jgi:hypothetical protein
LFSDVPGSGPKLPFQSITGAEAEACVFSSSRNEAMKLTPKLPPARSVRQFTPRSTPATRENAALT